VGDDELAAMWSEREQVRPCIVRWANVIPMMPHRLVTNAEHTSCFVLGHVEGRAVAISGSELGTLQVWDLA
jgi:hypothetical protein